MQRHIIELDKATKNGVDIGGYFVWSFTDNMEWQKGKCISLFSMDTYLEYCPPGATKAAGVDFICEYLDVPLKNTVAAGDERNDIPMLQEAHIGVAMKNAKEEVKACADYVTQRTNNEAGIAEVIEKFLLSES